MSKRNLGKLLAVFSVVCAVLGYGAALLCWSDLRIIYEVIAQ